MRTRIVFFVLLLSGFASQAQQDAQYTQYMYNTININPAYAGSRDVLSIFGLYRTQWVGLDGAPNTATFSIQTPIEGSKIGLGLDIVNDKLGPSDETNIALDASYYIKTSERYKLSFGIKGSANLYNVDFQKLNLYNSGDAKFDPNLDKKFSPNVGAGLYWYSDKTYFGLSVPNMLETKHFTEKAAATNFSAKERLNLYFIAGHVFDLNDNIKFKPSLFIKAVKGAPLQADISGNFMFNQKLVLGLAYRWSAAVSVMAGFQVTDGLYIGYGYDRETTRLAQFNSGSHEIFLRFELFKKYDKVILPRFF
jgi:type IX secretion system PorP/SprF family membrane protein